MAGEVTDGKFEVSGVTPGKNRVHVDLVSEDFQHELARLTALGATVLSTADTPSGKPSAVLADPQGNEFCLG